MSDVTEAPSQEAIAESLVGDQTEQVTAEQPQAGAEAVEQSEQFESQEAEQQTEQEQLDDWLPSEQDKVFSDDVYARYGARYQLSPEQAADPLIRQILHDKINSDIFIQQQQEQQQFEVPEPQLEPTQQQPQQPLTFEQHIQNLQTFVDQNTDPRIAQQFAGEFVKSFGVNEAVSPQVAQALTRTMSTFGLNLIQTALPQMITPMLDSIMPGFSGMYYQAGRATAWDTVRNSSPAYASLPAYGTREFMELCTRLDSENPGLTDYGYSLERLGNGQLQGQYAQKFYGTLAQLAVRQAQVNPQELLEAARTAGQRNARRAEVMRSAGNLGAGQSKGPMNRGTPKSQFQTNQDIFDEDAMEMYRKQHGSL